MKKKLIVKVQTEEGTHRYTFEDRPSFEAFCKISQPPVFTDEYCVSYIDDEDEKISITNEIEWQEAWLFGLDQSKQCLLRITLETRPRPSTLPAMDESHPVVCNYCTSWIVGTHFRCTDCADYNLCKNCVLKSDHPSNHHLTIHRESCPNEGSEIPHTDPLVYCNHCKKILDGEYRFKCTSCIDYDLCSTCYVKRIEVHGNDHEFELLMIEPRSSSTGGEHKTNFAVLNERNQPYNNYYEVEDVDIANWDSIELKQVLDDNNNNNNILERNQPLTNYNDVSNWDSTEAEKVLDDNINIPEDLIIAVDNTDEVEFVNYAFADWKEDEEEQHNATNDDYFLTDYYLNFWKHQQVSQPHNETPKEVETSKEVEDNLNFVWEIEDDENAEAANITDASDNYDPEDYYFNFGDDQPPQFQPQSEQEAQSMLVHPDKRGPLGELLVTLDAMGYHDEQLNRCLLVGYNFDLQKTIDLLLEQYHSKF